MVEFTDVRILAFGALGKPSTMFPNSNAHTFLYPPGIESTSLPAADQNFNSLVKSGNKIFEPAPIMHSQSALSKSSILKTVISQCCPGKSTVPTYTRLALPKPSLSHADYPFYTPSGRDKRWISSGALEEDGLRWVGGLLSAFYTFISFSDEYAHSGMYRLAAQLIGPHTHKKFVEGPVLQDVDLVVGLGRSQYASFTWEDFVAIAPWMEENVTKIIFGPGLGN